MACTFGAAIGQGEPTQNGTWTSLGLRVPGKRRKNAIQPLAICESPPHLACSAAALVDINLVRETAGGLDPIAAGVWGAMTQDQQLDELLYNKRYSLLFEGGHRWIDMRRYGKLGDITLSVSTNAPPPAFVVPALFPVPTQECDARAGEGVPSC